MPSISNHTSLVNVSNLQVPPSPRTAGRKPPPFLILGTCDVSLSCAMLMFVWNMIHAFSGAIWTY